ncbi:MAG: hypothetical protein K6A32_03445, partial [Bacteroidales bacterium]|nr:hypothetical protein [Bacteroidales bacterium]
MKYTRNLIAILMVLLPFNSWAQDDVYFVSKKKKTQTEQTTQQKTADDRYTPVQIVYADGSEDAYVSGSATRDVDEYNRRYTYAGTLAQQPDS